MDEASLLAAIRAEPDDDAPRLVYADWLQEQGDPRGEFIQLECEVDRGRAGRSAQQFERLRERAREVRAEHLEQIERAFPEWMKVERWSRGFPSSVRIPTLETAFEHRTAFAALPPIEFVHLRDESRLAFAPGFRHLSRSWTSWEPQAGSTTGTAMYFQHEVYRVADRARVFAWKSVPMWTPAHGPHRDEGKLLDAGFTPEGDAFVVTWSRGAPVRVDLRERL